MKTTKRPYTPVRVMDMLTEIKILCKRNQFVPRNFSEKEPSIWHFVRVLVAKGVLSKNLGVYKWIGGEPNFEMSKAVMEQVQEYAKARKEESLLRKKNAQKLVAEHIEFPTLDDVTTPIEQPIETIKEKPIVNYKKITKELQKEIVSLHSKIQSIETENESHLLKIRSIENFAHQNVQLRIIGEKNTAQLIKYENYVKQLAEEISEYREKISALSFKNKELEKQLNEILGSKSIVLEQEIEEMKKLIEAKPNTRKIKLFGITILKIE
jgi:hypothetical protein